MGYFANAGLILVEVLFGLAVSLFALRVLLQLVRANFYNPVCQFFDKATNPILMPLRKVIPPWRSWDIAGTLIAFLLECLKVLLLYLLAGSAIGFLGVLVLGFAESIAFLLGLYFWLILIRVILSFVGQGSYHPMVPLILQLTEPVLRPLRRILPDLGGIDLSPLLATLSIFLARALLVAPLHDLGAALARG
jgi:YggT family protein